MQEEGAVISGLLVGLNIIDCNFDLKGDSLDVWVSGTIIIVTRTLAQTRLGLGLVKRKQTLVGICRVVAKFSSRWLYCGSFIDYCRHSFQQSSRVAS